MLNKQIPVSIITGFLGAGKTTLLNEILRCNPDTNFLIIENEAGNINIDSQLIKNDTKSSVIELTGGCICCSLSTDLSTVLNRVIMSGVKYDYLLIEATGMADSGQIINMFSGARVQRYFNLDGVVCLIDASSFLKCLNDFDEVRSQLAKADIAIINKSDLLSHEQMNELEQKLVSINPLARIEKTTYGQIENIPILNIESFSPSKAEKDILNFSNLSYVNTDKDNGHKIQTFSYTIPGSFDMERMSRWFERFLFQNKDNFLRVKALVSIHDMQHKMILQSVGSDFHVSQGNQWTDDDIKENKIVIIGTGLHEDEIKTSLYALAEVEV
jgi:G3E family GTPase